MPVGWTLPRVPSLQGGGKGPGPSLPGPSLPVPGFSGPPPRQSRPPNLGPGGRRGTDGNRKCRPETDKKLCSLVSFFLSVAAH